MNVSVLILTRDEEVNLAGCLDSVRWCDDVVVLDSLSTDRTVEIARSHGARVVERAFDDYARQRNHGLREIEYRHPWLLMLDADERVPEELHREIEAAARDAAPETCLYRVRRKDFLFGRWIRSSGYPTWFGRLARVGRVWVERPVNEQYVTDGRIGLLRGHLHHYPFNKGFSAWLLKHDRYSSMEATLRLEEPPAPARVAEFASRDPEVRRRALKRLAYRLPARPLLMFLALYIGKRGFAEGRAGLTFSMLRAWYEYMIDCKYREACRRRAGQPV